MKETLVDLVTRRSCRAYKKEQISDEELDMVLTAGTFAPTAMNQQSPIIVVVQDAKTIAAMSELNAKVMGADIDPFYGAPTVCVIMAPKDAKCGVQDGSLVIGNMLNAAHALGIGSCWINRAKEVFDSAEGKALMAKWGIDDNYEGIGNCILGYPEKTDVDAAPRKADYIRKV